MKDVKIKDSKRSFISKGDGKKCPANCETHAKIQNFHIIPGI